MNCPARGASRNFFRFGLLVPLCAFGPATAPGFAQETQRGRLEARDGGWVRVESFGTYAVDPEVISVRFRGDIGNLRRFLAASPQLAGTPIASSTVLRSNKLGIHDLRLPRGSDLIAVLEALRSNPLVEFAEESALGEWTGVPNDSQFNVQWHLRNTGQSGGTADADVDADEAWDITSGSPSVVIAVLDSGTEISHPDLAANLWKNSGETPANGIDDDGNGFIDDFDGWDFANNNNQVPGPFFHGTFVAGVIGARTNNGSMVAGLAGGFTSNDGCRVMPIGVGDAGPVASAIDDAVIYAADNGARIITLSLTVPSSAAIDAAFVYARHTKGVFIDCASGNGGGAIAYPASHVDVVAVGATDRNDAKAGFSNFGTKLWVVAPGVDIRSTTTGATTTDSSGTSFSAPLVAATAGLMLSVMPSLTANDLQQLLKLSAKDLGAAGFDNGTGWGRINAKDALSLVLASDCNGNGLYDPAEITAGSSLDVNTNGVPDECELTVYCTAKVNSQGCVPAIQGLGVASASAPTGMVIRTTNVLNNKVGLMLYTNGGRASTPFAGGTLCVGVPLKRTPGTNSGGSPTGTDCSGIYTIDLNAFARGTLGGNPLPELSVIGTKIDCQWWGRDPGFAAPDNSTLSAGLELFVGP